MLNSLVTVVFLAMAVASVSMTLTKSKVFGTLRERIDERSEFFGELIHCPYCTSHYVSLGAVLLFQPVVATSGFHVIDLLASAFAMVTASSFFCGVIFYSLAGMGNGEEE